MAFEFEIPGELIKQVDRLGDAEVAKEMVDAGLEVYKKYIQKALEPHRDSGDLIKSINTEKAKASKNGTIIGNVDFKGLDRKGESNMVKALALEYGTYKQAATPFMATATNNAEKETIEKMQNVYNKKVER